MVQSGTNKGRVSRRMRNKTSALGKSDVPDTHGDLFWGHVTSVGFVEFKMD